jgi:hypothetical protein
MGIWWCIALANALKSFFRIFLPSSLPNLLEVVQRARPSYNPRGTCPCWSEHQPRWVGQSPSPNSYIAHGIMGGGETGGLHSLVPFMVPPGCRTRNFSALSGILALAILAQEAVDHVVVVEDLAPVPNLQRQ